MTKISPEATKLGMDWRRDRSICTAEELRDRWTGDERIAIDRIIGGKFEEGYQLVMLAVARIGW